MEIKESLCPEINVITEIFKQLLDWYSSDKKKSF